MKRFYACIISLLLTASFAQSDESSNLNYGMKLFNDKVYDVAITQFRYFLEKYPSSVSAPKVQFHLAESYDASGDRESALKNYQRLILEYPGSEYTEQAIFKAAGMFYDLGEREKAARYYLQLRNYFPKSAKVPESYYNGIRIFSELDMTEEVKESSAILKKNFSSSPYSAMTQLILAGIYEKEKQTALADRTYGEVFRMSSDDVKAMAGLEYSAFLIRQNDLSSAKKVLKEAYGKTSKKEKYYFELLKAYSGMLLDTGSPDEALRLVSSEKSVPEEYRKDLLIISSDARALKGDYAAAVSGYDEALTVSSDISTVLKRARALAATGRNEEAASDIRTFVTGGTISAEDRTAAGPALLFAAENYIAAEKHSDALTVLRKYSELFPGAQDSPRIDFMTARAYYDSGNYQQAYEYLKKHQEIYPASEFADDALFLSAESALKIRDWKKALEQYSYLTQNYGASEFAGLAKKRITYLNDHKIREDNLNDKLADLSSRSLFENDKQRLVSDWARFYFYDLKDYVKAADFVQKFYGISGKAKPDPEIRFIEAVSAVRSGTTDKSKLSSAYDILKSILTDSSLQKIRRSRSASEMLDLAGDIFEGEELTRQLDGIFGVVTSENLDDIDCTLGLLYITEIGSLADPAVLTDAIDRIYTDKTGAATYRQAMFLKAESQKKNGNVGKASEIYRTLVSVNINDAPGFGSLNALADLPSVPAEERLVFLSSLEKSFPYVYSKDAVVERRAGIYLSAGMNEKALAEYLVISEKPGISAKIGGIYSDLGDYARAESYYLKALSSPEGEKDRSSLLASLSEIYRLTGNREALEDNLKAISGLSGGESGYEAALALADLEFEKDNVTKSVSLYQDILKKYKPEDRKPVESKIIIAQYTKKSISDGDKLLADFRKKYKDDYDKNEYEPEFYLSKSNGYLAMKEYDKALKGYKALSKDYPESRLVPKAMYGEAIVLYNIGKKDEAFEIWKKIVENYPDDDISVETNYHLGAVYNNREEFDKAITCFQNIIKFRRDHSLKKNAYKNIIDLYLKLGFNDAGAKMIRDYISFYPDEEDVFQKRIEIGNIYQRNGEFDTALDYFKRLIYEAKGDDEAACQFFIAETYMMMKNFRQAITEFMKVKYMIKTNSPFEWGLTAMYNTALCYEELTEYDKALDILNEIVSNHPSDSYGRQAKKIVERIEGKKNIER